MISFILLLFLATAVNSRTILKRGTLASGGPGPATNYDTRGAPGACGWQNTNYDYLVALNPAQFSHSLCGKVVEITVTATGATVRAMVADLCGPGGTCAVQSGIDTSNAAFKDLGGDFRGDIETGMGYGNVVSSWIIYDEDYSAGGNSPENANPATSTWPVSLWAVQPSATSSFEVAVAARVASHTTTSSASMSANPKIKEKKVADPQVTQVAANSTTQACTDGQIQCSADKTTWSMCSNGQLVDMGPLAEGTDCPDGGVTAGNNFANVNANSNTTGTHDKSASTSQASKSVEASASSSIDFRRGAEESGVGGSGNSTINIITGDSGAGTLEKHASSFIVVFGLFWFFL